MKQDLVDALLAHAGLVAEVGAEIDWGERRQGVDRGILLDRIGGGPTYELHGRTRLTDTLVRMDVFGPDAPTVDRITQQLRLAIDTLQAAPFRGAVIEDENDDFIRGDGPDGDEAGDFHLTSLDVRVWHSH